MRADFGRSSGRQYLAKVEHGDVMADVEDQIGVMFHYKHAGTGPRDRQDERAKPLDLLGRKSGRRLVKQQVSRAHHQRASDLGEAQLAVLQPVGAHRSQPFQPDRQQSQHGGVVQRRFVASMARQREQ